MAKGVAMPVPRRGAERDTADLVRRYLDEIGSVPLLTAAEEVALAKRIEAGVYAAELLRQADAGERRLAAKLRGELTVVAEDGRRAKDRMIRANLRLVVAIVKRQPRRGLPLLDAIQEGNLGLIRSVEKFDYTKGFKFSTYATWWIRQALSRGTATQYRTIRLPVHLTEELDRLDRIDRDLGLRLGREPSVDELAEAAAMPAERVGALRRTGRDVVSLDTVLGADGRLRLADVLADTAAMSAAELAERRALAADVRAMVAALPPREAMVITQRYGLSGQSRTLQEISEDLGLSRERVRQIEQHALALLRESRGMLLPWTG